MVCVFLCASCKPGDDATASKEPAHSHDHEHGHDHDHAHDHGEHAVADAGKAEVPDDGNASADVVADEVPVADLNKEPAHDKPVADSPSASAKAAATPGPDPQSAATPFDRSKLEPPCQQQLVEIEAKVEADPDNAELVGALGTLYHAYGLLPDAAAAYSRAIELAPDEFAWHYLRGHVGRAIGQDKAAADDFRAARELKPDYVPVTVFLARSLMMLKDARGAAELLQPLVDRGSKEPVIMHNLGLAYLEMGEPVYALEYLKPVWDANPNMGQVVRDVARTFDALGQKEKAEEIRENAPDNDFSPTLSDPQLVAIYRGTVGVAAEKRMALAFVAAGDAQQAIAHYTAALEYSPKDADALASRGDLFMQIGQTEKAEQDFKAALEADPNQGLALMREGQLHLVRGENEEAQKLVERARKVWPNNSTILAMEARLATLRGDYQAAVKALQEATIQDAANVDLQLELGAAYWQAGDRREASKVFRTTAVANPQYIPALLAAADSYYEQGAKETAETWYLRAYDAGSSNASSCYAAGMQAMKNGDYSKAEEALKRGLAHTPDHVLLNDALAKMYAICPYSVYRNGEEAVKLARKAHGDDDANISVHGLNTLSAAYAEAGDFDRAAKLAQIAIDKLEGEGKDLEARRIHMFKNMFEQHKHIYELDELLEQAGD